MKNLNNYIVEKFKITNDIDTNAISSSLNQLIKDLIKKYDKKEITGEVFVATLKEEIQNQNDAEIKLLKGSWEDGTIEYEGDRYKIKYIQDKHWYKDICLYWKGVNGNPNGNGFFINNSKDDFDDPSLKYVWVDKDGNIHDTERDWDKAKGINDCGPHMTKVNFQASIEEFIKRWAKLQKI